MLSTSKLIYGRYQLRVPVSSPAARGPALCTPHTPVLRGRVFGGCGAVVGEGLTACGGCGAVVGVGGVMGVGGCGGCWGGVVGVGLWWTRAAFDPANNCNRPVSKAQQIK